MSVQMIFKDGNPEYAVLPYDMCMRLQMVSDMAADVAAFDQAMLEIELGEELIPLEIMQTIWDGEHPIKVWREYRGLTQQVLAEQVGISTAYLSQLETGKCSGTVDVLQRVARALQVSLEDVVELGDE